MSDLYFSDATGDLVYLGSCDSIEFTPPIQSLDEDRKRKIREEVAAMDWPEVIEEWR